MAKGYSQTKGIDFNETFAPVAKNSIHHARTKHIDIQHHFVREKIESQEVEIIYCGTEEMIADILTKGLHKEHHHLMLKGLGLKSLQSGSVGG